MQQRPSALTGPKGLPLLGCFLSMARNPPEFYLSVAREHGGLARFRLGSQITYLVTDPIWVKEILLTQARKLTKGLALTAAKRIVGEGILTSEGDFHLRQRRMIQPAFHRARLEEYAEVIVKEAAHLRDSWVPGQAVDIQQEMMKATVSVITRVLFSSDSLNDLESGQASIPKMDLQAMGARFESLLQMVLWVTLPFHSWLRWLPLPANRRFREASESLNREIFRAIEQRRARGIQEGDLLTFLLRAQDPEHQQARGSVAAGSLGFPGSSAPHELMSDQQLRDEVMTLFLAGHETTTNGLTWLFWCMERNPECRAKVEAEVDHVLGGRLPTYQDVERLEYCMQAVLEALRLRPPVWNIGRRAVEAVQLGPHVLPPGSIVLLSPYAMHHLESNFPDPGRFDPERWSDPEAFKALKRYIYIPFGAGPRVCIGENFALVEMVLFLAVLSTRHRLRVKDPERVRTQAMITLRPRGGLPGRVEARA